MIYIINLICRTVTVVFSVNLAPAFLAALATFSSKTILYKNYVRIESITIGPIVLIGPIWNYLDGNDNTTLVSLLDT